MSQDPQIPQNSGFSPVSDKQPDNVPDGSRELSFIAVARIVRTRGNRGEVLADLYTDYPERFDDLAEVWLEFDDGRRQNRVCKTLEDVWEHKGRAVLKFAGVDTIGDAEAFIGCWVVLPVDQAVQLPEDTYFDHDLVGCSVEDIHGAKVGTVAGVLHIADNTQLVVHAENAENAENEDGRGGDSAGREYLIPAVARICVKISIPEKRIVIDPPEGLMDLM